ncbi:hypothetical protein [Moraxella equi]|uniref:Uncharacterized protein n=1 Tax=Moraxella equi TaxID=60442 RepID=A0A378QYS2_9GAMM|nr:hypothetical protein [Moraxella equi]OPH38882.1 hypothetical protein B5J93_05165 [Moraxella equi]STZ04603.1 Uncharacterised protein [Moraxella equi]
MITLDLPPQVETQLVQIAKQQNMSASDYLVSMAEKLVAEQQGKDLDEMYEFLGLSPFTTGTHTITDKYINELREEHGI